MSNGFADDLDSEYPDAYDDSEGYDDGEAYDDTESAASRARRRRARALARRRAAARQAARPAGRLPATAPPRAVVSAVKELGLQTQEQQDSLRDVVAAQNKKIERGSLVTVGALLIPEAFRTFGEPDNALVRAGILATPLLLAPRGRAAPASRASSGIRRSTAAPACWRWRSSATSASGTRRWSPSTSSARRPMTIGDTTSSSPRCGTAAASRRPSSPPGSRTTPGSP